MYIIKISASSFLISGFKKMANKTAYALGCFFFFNQKKKILLYPFSAESIMLPFIQRFHKKNINSLIKDEIIHILVS